MIFLNQEWGHFNQQFRAKMVDVSDKKPTLRVAVAKSHMNMSKETMERIREHTIGKGDVLGVAQIAGIMAAKKTPDWIPMCHPLQLSGVNLMFKELSDTEIEIEAIVKTTGPTGVEMEALTAVSAAALTIYDMCKAIDKDMVIGPTYLMSKSGGKSGIYIHGAERCGE